MKAPRALATTLGRLGGHVTNKDGTYVEVSDAEPWTALRSWPTDGTYGRGWLGLRLGPRR